MSLTSYRAAPPRVRPGWARLVRPGWPGGRVARWWWRCGLGVGGMVGGPGGDLLSHVLRRSTMGASGFHGRVRNGVGWGTRAIGHQVEQPPPRPRRGRGRAAGAARPRRGRARAADAASDAGKLLAWAGWLCGCRWRGSRSIERLGPVSCARRRASTSGLSTWWSTTALMARPGFEVGFPLRCFQRLSRPNLATRLRGWRHDRSTRGSSTPVLSY